MAKKQKEPSKPCTKCNRRPAISGLKFCYGARKRSSRRWMTRSISPKQQHLEKQTAVEVKSVSVFENLEMPPN